MAYNESRLSTFSTGSNSGYPRSTHSHPTQLSTQTLLNSLHTSYSASRPYQLESSTSLVINTWLTAAAEGHDGRPAGIVDPELASRAWEHARRRAEDGCIVLGSLHESTPSLLAPFIASLPIATPEIFYTALAVVRPFLNCVTPQNPNTSRQSSLAAAFTLSMTGNLTGCSLKLSTSGIDIAAGLLNVPAQPGYRAFDVFYYLLSSAATPQEREALALRHASGYSLLKRSGTYDSPSYMPTVDDSAAAEEFRDNLKAVGISGRARRDLVSTLAAILKLGDTLGYTVDGEELESACEDAATLLGIDPEFFIHGCSTEERYIFAAGLYESTVDWVMRKANDAITKDFGKAKTRKSSGSSGSGVGHLTPPSSDDKDDSATITVLEIPSPQLGKAVALKTVFDDSDGINAEMKQDGVSVTVAGHSVLTEMQNAVSASEPELGIMDGHAGREKELENDRRDSVMEKISHEIEGDGFLTHLLYPIPGAGLSLGRLDRFDLSTVIGSSRSWFQLCLHPTDESPANVAATSAPWSAGSPSRQLRSWRLPEWANRRNKNLDYTADFDLDEFSTRYSRLGCKDGRDGIESFILQRGWSNGEVNIGAERVWIREAAWWEAERMLDMVPVDHTPGGANQLGGNYQVHHPETGSGFFGSPFGDNAMYQESKENLLQRNQSSATLDHQSAMAPRSIEPTAAPTTRNVSRGDYGLGSKGDDKGGLSYVNELDPELADPKNIHEQPLSKVRRAWITTVWALTWWIPSFLLSGIGRMKRPDVRQAWREKVVLCFFIAILNAFIIFFIIAFGRILCPNYDKAWDNKQVSYHQGTNDFYVSIRGVVYDISKFWQLDHSGPGTPPVQSSQMEPLAGQNLDILFPAPLYVACPSLVSDQSFQLRYNVSSVSQNIQGSTGPPAQHLSGSQAAFRNSDLGDPNWYSDTFLPKMKEYYKGALVYSKSDVKNQGENLQRPWVIINGKVYDLSDYFYTQSQFQKQHGSQFLDPRVEDLFQENMGQDISSQWKAYTASNSTGAYQNYLCLNNAFYKGQTDFRDTARCQAINYILLAFAITLCAVILTKFLSALQLGGKKRPSPQDKFVICQVPAYTEGEDHLRKGLDSLTALAYDNKRKLICVICDGMIVGGGNDRPTPKIVLDILGVDPKIDPPALPFKSVGAGNEQLNYGKVYSGLYEYEGNVVPYLVVVKVGKESEQNKSKPGNRGKRDSQIMLMSFLNRVHHRAPMSPLELEMFHQINNIIGVDPELYEYMFMVDADTQVKEDALNRLVASCAHDAKIAGICGETSLENEERSWTTMIQVYEYYISHHLAKAFESLFGSVTCLPGCFCMYRLRTADKGKPLIISEKVINDYSIQSVDTLHKKNLLSLGEDRYLTTLMTKYFPHMSYKFVPSAYAQTAAPEEWSVLLSQRRRWINSTIHNLAELVFLKDLCGFCCFSMRFVVFIDLFGTIILPATCAYIGYLIYRIATSPTNFPLISVVMIAAVYGLQMLIFLIKRQWQHIGWMIIYILAFPIYAFILPVYSFWKQDDFSWGNTRVVIGEKGSKQVILSEDEGFNPRSIPLQTWDDYALQNHLPGRRGFGTGSEKQFGYDDGYEMDDIRSVYSSAKPASTILTGMKSQQAFHMPPQSPAPLANARPPMQQRQSTMSQFTAPYTDNPSPMYNPHMSHMTAGSEHGMQSPHMNMPTARSPGFQSTDNLMGGHVTPSPGMSPMNRAGRLSPMGMTAQSRPGSTINPPNFQQNASGHGEPSDAMIVEAIQSCLASVDLDSVTKKQLKALTEQRLQTQLGAERRAFLDRQIDNELANM